MINTVHVVFSCMPNERGHNGLTGI